MANLIYASINGIKQGLISAGCSTLDSIGNRCQKGHEDQLYILAFDHNISRMQNVSHQPVRITKPIDKSSPLLGMAISNNEKLQIVLYMYRVNPAGTLEVFYTIKLKDAYITDISQHCPNALTQNDGQPYEIISLSYKSIDWQHNISGTSGYSIWDEQVY
ncbi:TPA: Hcp family type VI secretion system effector [Serratia fonticola]|jgi:type VI secretion system Hcp family effector|uniref:Hcp family type VI secretion system effector n=1 Tax=Serratia fonticola TaxID=47917 RepID=UPI001575B20E|nr:Hcp family type VI secretion system effector [Serratia fonticola]NTY90085.1 Hcp family type VI secretion system effector [Serratia fonticola]NTZ15968.1 Hcp family type VI secretion system effector [Serratia fonticola]CAI1695892.1 Secreted protein hcp [Serratia fonticola]HBE9179086.1 Hcp family type VI secretion system effector [Serratia fonticola]